MDQIKIFDRLIASMHDKNASVTRAAFPNERQHLDYDVTHEFEQAYPDIHIQLEFSADLRRRLYASVSIQEGLPHRLCKY